MTPVEQLSNKPLEPASAAAALAAQTETVEMTRPLGVVSSPAVADLLVGAVLLLLTGGASP